MARSFTEMTPSEKVRVNGSFDKLTENELISKTITLRCKAEIMQLFDILCALSRAFGNYVSSCKLAFF